MFSDPISAGTVLGLERMHALKTGALIRAAVRLGALATGTSVADLTALDRYAAALGLAFQIRDDILDVEGDSAALGKTAGKDANQDKATYPALLGMAETKARLAALSTEMDDCLRHFGPRADALRLLGQLAVQRQH